MEMLDMKDNKVIKSVGYKFVIPYLITSLPLIRKNYKIKVINNALNKLDEEEFRWFADIFIRSMSNNVEKKACLKYKTYEEQALDLINDHPKLKSYEPYIIASYRNKWIEHGLLEND